MFFRKIDCFSVSLSSRNAGIKNFNQVNLRRKFVKFIRIQTESAHRVEGVRNVDQAALLFNGGDGMLQGDAAGDTFFEKHAHHFTVISLDFFRDDDFKRSDFL